MHKDRRQRENAPIKCKNGKKNNSCYNCVQMLNPTLEFGLHHITSLFHYGSMNNPYSILNIKLVILVYMI